jgi:hypothetical protein
VSRVTWFRRIAVVAASTALAVAAGTAGAQAAINRQWRIVYHVDLKLPNYWRYGGLAAPSRDQAWALGTRSRAGESLATSSSTGTAEAGG